MNRLSFKPSALFISFDAVAMSGITVEALKIAKKIQQKNIPCYLDLGYDIKIDKGNFNKPYKDEYAQYQGIFTLTRLPGLTTIPDYNQTFLHKVYTCLIIQSTPINAEQKKHLLQRVEHCAQQVADALYQHWQTHNVRYLIVENGTLPENIIYTRALYIAIKQYGQAKNLARFVLWRDHDLMWNSEKGAQKYGPPPWPHAVKPIHSPHISYVTLNNDLKEKLERWCDEPVEIQVKKNTYDFTLKTSPKSLRKKLNISDTDIVIARTTRIIPQKRIDRDIILTHRLNQLFLRDASPRKVWLLIAGDENENYTHYKQLRQHIDRLQLTDCVCFLGSLPHDCMPNVSSDWSIEDLYHACDLVSFLTSWDYDSYGNPVGEAISSKRCYISSQYEYYQEVYGQYGFQAPIMPTSFEDDGLPQDAFIADVYALLNDAVRMQNVAEENYQLGKRVLTNDILDTLLCDGRRKTMRDNIFVSVVLPVFNESDRLESVLQSLYQQESIGKWINHQTYEVIIVDNNSTDDSLDKINQFRQRHPQMDIHIIKESIQGVSSARKRGMDYASLRAKTRDHRLGIKNKHYIVSADADCTVDPYWLYALINEMMRHGGDLGTCNYFYDEQAFQQRPNLFNEIQKTLRCRAFSFSLFGGFPDGKGFAVERELYDKIGGIEIFYQLNKGKFVEHLSDDWDFGIRAIAWGGKAIYAHESRVEINSRRVDTILDEVITGIAYGQDGTIIMKDVRPDSENHRPALRDTTTAETLQAWYYSIKDYMPKNIILPVLLNPARLLEEAAIRDFFGAPIADRLYQRIHEIKYEMRIIDFKPIHAYKTPAYRLYFEFRDELFAALRRAVGDDIGFPPPLPPCFDEVAPEDFNRFVWYYCEDRESGEAHNYFANGGVF